MPDSVSPKEIHRSKVFDLSSQGWGVCKSNEGKIVFVPGTWLGDEIEFEIIKTGKFYLGRATHWISKSNAHRTDPCPYSGYSEQHCGGCPWGAFNYSEQLAAKNLKVAKALERHRIPFEQVLPIQGSTNEYGYRNRITLHKNKNKIGLHASLSNNLVTIEKCLVCTPELNKQIGATLANVSEAKNFTLDGDILLQEATHQSFMQGNSGQNINMKTYLSALLSNSENSTTLIELFSGDGNFTEVIKSYAQRIYAYESGEDAIQRLKSKRLDGVIARTANLYSYADLNKIASDARGADTLVLDPPRSGFKDLSGFADSFSSLKKIVYISCDIMTFCRDVASLSPKWKRKKLGSFDMFPQTPHVELIALLEKS